MGGDTFRFERYVNVDVVIVLFNQKTFLFISETRMNFGRGIGAAWGRFGLMRDIQ